MPLGRLVAGGCVCASVKGNLPANGGVLMSATERGSVSFTGALA